MSRIQADLLLLITAVIWGTAFIAQKTGMEGIGPLTFVGSRFILSFLVVAPLCLLERKKSNLPELTRKDAWLLLGLSASFFPGVYLQQAGLVSTSVTNAGFLTGLYVVLVPFVYWILFRKPPARLIWPASLIALLGVWLLNGAKISAFVTGDWLVLASAFFFAVHVAMIGLVAYRTRRPLMCCAVQYAACGLCGLILGASLEGFTAATLQANALPICYAGIVSGGIAYTLQAIAQQHSPPSDAAIILSGESLFAALAAFVILHERVDAMGVVGCVLILSAMLLVEWGSLNKPRTLA
jgi:drug/metabolite transporter (DMT)-like permease